MTEFRPYERMKKMVERRRNHVSPLGSLEAAAMNLSAAARNLVSYTVSDGWKEGGGRQKDLVQYFLLNRVLQAIILN